MHEACLDLVCAYISTSCILHDPRPVHASCTCAVQCVRGSSCCMGAMYGGVWRMAYAHTHAVRRMQRGPLPPPPPHRIRMGIRTHLAPMQPGLMQPISCHSCVSTSTAATKVLGIVQDRQWHNASAFHIFSTPLPTHRNTAYVLLMSYTTCTQGCTQGCTHAFTARSPCKRIRRVPSCVYCKMGLCAPGRSI